MTALSSGRGAQRAALSETAGCVVGLNGSYAPAWAAAAVAQPGVRQQTLDLHTELWRPVPALWNCSALF